MLLFSVLFLAGSAIKKHSGTLLVGFIESHAVPYVLKTEDVAMGCVMAEALTLLVPSLAEMNASPYKLQVIFGFLSGSCSEFKAWEQELRYIRALYSKNISEAQDARILQKRFLNQAASRQLKGFRSLQLAYAEKPGLKCPKFTGWHDEFYWLVGLMDGLQAVLNDLASEGQANVPLDISLKVGRGAGCLNNKKWWGIPRAVQAAIWVSFPAHKPKHVDPIQVLQDSVQIGLKQGMRIVQVIAAKIHIGLGNNERVKAIIRNNVNTRDTIPANPDYLFLDKVTTLQLMAVSDKMWTEATGMRTPVGGLGSFWDRQEKAVDTVDIADIL